jgi:hypothetical protein
MEQGDGEGEMKLDNTKDVLLEIMNRLKGREVDLQELTYQELSLVPVLDTFACYMMEKERKRCVGIAKAHEFGDSGHMVRCQRDCCGPDIAEELMK